MPNELQAAAQALRQLPDDGVLVLRFMYADYVAYASGKKMLWGGHCGDLRPFERISPILREPIAELLAPCGALCAARRNLRDDGGTALDKRGTRWRGGSLVLLEPWN